MLCLPREILLEGIFSHLTIRDLQSLNVAVLVKYRSLMSDVWRGYQYDAPKGSLVSMDDLIWLRSVGADVNGVNLPIESDVNYISYVADNFPTLKRFGLTKEYYYYKEQYWFTDDLLIRLAEGCQSLCSFHVVESPLTNAGISSLVQTCKQLHTLVIVTNDFITDDAIELVCSYCPLLQDIGLSYCENLTDASLFALANRYPRLRSINIRESNFTDDAIIYLAGKCRELRALDVRCDEITSRGLFAIWSANPNLVDIRINNNEFLSNDDVTTLARNCLKLQTVCLSATPLITDAAIVALTEHCPEVTSLDVHFCYNISDASLIALGKRCEKLKSINISSIDYITDDGVAALASAYPMLQEFDASAVDNITYHGIALLTQRCRNLRKIGIRHFGSRVFRAVSAIAENCPFLSDLSLFCCKGVDDSCLSVIAQHCHNLVYLCISKTRATQKGVRKVLKSCRNLRELYLPPLRKKFVNDIAIQYPYVLMHDS